jgi:hypothetical protein
LPRCLSDRLEIAPFPDVVTHDTDTGDLDRLVEDRGDCAYGDCLRPTLHWRGWRRAFSGERCGQALVRHPDEGMHLAKFPGKLAPGIARIGAADRRVEVYKANMPIEISSTLRKQSSKTFHPEIKNARPCSVLGSISWPTQRDWPLPLALTAMANITSTFDRGAADRSEKGRNGHQRQR